MNADRLDVRYVTNPEIDNDALNELFRSSWPSHADRDFNGVLSRSLAHVSALASDRLVGFVNIAWYGGEHAFLLDPTVHPEFQRRGIGIELIRHAVIAVRAGQVEWLHVDYEPGLSEFYRRCGFRPTAAGVLMVSQGSAESRSWGAR